MGTTPDTQDSHRRRTRTATSGSTDQREGGREGRKEKDDPDGQTRRGPPSNGKVRRHSTTRGWDGSDAAWMHLGKTPSLRENNLMQLTQVVLSYLFYPPWVSLWPRCLARQLTNREQLPSVEATAVLLAAAASPGSLRPAIEAPAAARVAQGVEKNRRGFPVAHPVLRLLGGPLGTRVSTSLFSRNRPSVEQKRQRKSNIRVVIARHLFGDFRPFQPPHRVLLAPPVSSDVISYFQKSDTLQREFLCTHLL